MIYSDASRSFEGYTLFATIGGDSAFLVDGAGKTVKTWRLPDGLKAFRVEIEEQGNLLLQCIDGSERWPFGGAGAALIELDWSGSTVWEYRDPVLHHDSSRLANGNLLVIGWESLGPEIAAKVQGGVANSGSEDGSIIGDFLREIDRQGKTVWEWHSHEHLDPEIERICPLEARREWTHCNSVEELPDGNLLISFRQTSGVGIIDRTTGEMKWRLPPGIASHQHAPTRLTNGSFLIFDNGEHRHAPTLVPSGAEVGFDNAEHRIGGGTFSRVVELDPAAQRVTWEYRASPADSFFSMGISNAQRLPNGNTMICEGRSGRIFEVTPEGDIVWDYWNPYGFPFRNEPRQWSVYRAYRYGANSPQIKNRI